MDKKTVLTCGTFDLFHVAHKRLLERAYFVGKNLEQDNLVHLIVGVSSDNLNRIKKNKDCVYPLEERMEIVSSIKYVSEVFVEESLEEKRNYILKYKADIFVIGDDHKGKYDDLNDICKVVYIPRTPDISTTELLEKIRKKE
jgi:glycerol-3-phosphate cytidylyltransferase